MFSRPSLLHDRLRQADFGDPGSVAAVLLEAVASPQSSSDEGLRRCLYVELNNDDAPFHRFLSLASAELSNDFHKGSITTSCCILCIAAATGDCEMIGLLLTVFQQQQQPAAFSYHLRRVLRCAIVNGHEGAAAMCAAALRGVSSVEATFLSQLTFLLSIEASGDSERTEWDFLSSLRALLAVCSEDRDEMHRCVELLVQTPVASLQGHGTILHLAVMKEYRQLLRSVVSVAVEVAVPRSRDATGIVTAARIPGLNSCDANGLSPLGAAVMMRDLCAARILLTHGASPFFPCLQSRDSSTWRPVCDWLTHPASEDKQMAAALATDEEQAARSRVEHLRCDVLCDDLGDKLRLSVCASSCASTLANLADGLLKKRRSSGLEDFPDEALRLLLAALDIDPWNPVASTWMEKALAALAPDLRAEWQGPTNDRALLLRREVCASADDGRCTITPPFVNVQVGEQSTWLSLPAPGALETLLGVYPGEGGKLMCAIGGELCGVVCSVTAAECQARKGDLVFFTASQIAPGAAAFVATRVIRSGPVVVPCKGGRTTLRQVRVGASALEGCDVAMWLGHHGGEGGLDLVIDQLQHSLLHRERWTFIVEQRAGRRIWANELPMTSDGSAVKCCELLQNGVFPNESVLLVQRDSGRLIGVECGV